MAYGDSGSGSGSGNSNNSVTFKGFSSRADKKNFKLYDFEVAKQDLINRLSIRKGERVENPEFGTIIYDAIFEPFTEALKDAIVEDITANLNADPRISTEEILVSEADKGIAIQATITYVPLNITEKLRFNFDEDSLLRLS
jgi:phage baseplate assembly protein W|tara:strand:+ start:1473 stop:1895 length:423 start_codon:yes stop_codon:yes gene_type:complete